MACLSLQAQDKVPAGLNKIPAGFKKGTLVMEDSSVVSGYIREYIRCNASLVLLAGPKGKRQRLDGTQIRSVQLDGTCYRCIRGDFFKVLSEGRLCFLQKAGDASGRPVYNGTEPLLINGTDGRLDDYFIYDVRDESLRVITPKTLYKVVLETFSDCRMAIDKAKGLHNDIPALRAVVEVYNNQNK
jgi:hypothetical protein